MWFLEVAEHNTIPDPKNKNNHRPNPLTLLISPIFFLLLSFTLPLSAHPSSLRLYHRIKVEMASTAIGLLSPPLLFHGRKPNLRPPHKLPVSAFGESQRRITVVAKATGESSEPSIVESVQNIWDKSEDRIALVGLGFTGVVAVWASINLVSAIDKLPLVPSTLELIGVLFSWWFIYRYLLFKPNREEFYGIVKKSISDILGQ